MTKLIQQLNFSSSINNYANYYDVDGIESNLHEPKNYLWVLLFSIDRYLYS